MKLQGHSPWEKLDRQQSKRWMDEDWWRPQNEDNNEKSMWSADWKLSTQEVKEQVWLKGWRVDTRTTTRDRWNYTQWAGRNLRVCKNLIFESDKSDLRSGFRVILCNPIWCVWHLQLVIKLTVLLPDRKETSFSTQSLFFSFILASLSFSRSADQSKCIPPPLPSWCQFASAPSGRNRA